MSEWVKPAVLKTVVGWSDFLTPKGNGIWKLGRVV